MLIPRSEKELQNEFLEIATALEGGTLTVFAGTGFSMHVTNGSAPSWLQLLHCCAESLEEPNLLTGLFTFDQGKVMGSKFDLTVCAQILEDEYKARGEHIREKIASIISERINEMTIDEKIVNNLRRFFRTHKEVSVVTTNYDTLFSEHIMLHNSRVYVEGSTLPKVSGIKNIYHIHGAISQPESIVLTQDDYFRFQHRETYISRKFYTLLQETTCVIVGYSLGDFNLNSVLNESKYSRQSSGKRNDIYYISRSQVDDVIKKYYFSTFGIQVIECYEIDEFFEELEAWTTTAKRIIRGAERIPKLLDGTKEYKDEFLKLRSTFGTIIARLTAAGYSLHNRDVLNFLMDILQRKRDFSRESDAWDQYAHLASWLIELGSQIDISSETYIRESYLNMVDYSFTHMSKRLTVGYAWAAYEVWKSGWNTLLEGTKNSIRELVGETRYLSLCGVASIVD